jgi:hypothetical protein
MNHSEGPITHIDSEFDRARALTGTDVEGSHGANLDPGWRIGNAVNGGLLLSLAGTALRRQLS